MTTEHWATSPRQVGLWVELTDEARGDLVLKLGTGHDSVPPSANVSAPRCLAPCATHR